MTPTRRNEGISPEQRPVFLDESGRRRRLVNRFGACLAVGCAAYAVVVGGEMAQTGVGPLAYVPAAGNGLIAGFPSDPGVPGLLAAGVPNYGRVATRAIRPAAAGSSIGSHIQPVRTHGPATPLSSRSESASTSSPATSAHTRRKLT